MLLVRVINLKGYRLCRRPLQRLMIAGLKQWMKLILGELVGARGREGQAVKCIDFHEKFMKFGGRTKSKCNDFHLKLQNLAGGPCQTAWISIRNSYNLAGGPSQNGLIFIRHLSNLAGGPSQNALIFI